MADPSPPAPIGPDDPVLVTGGAGFIGSHLVEALAVRGTRVTVVDDLSTGRLDNVAAVGDRVALHRMDAASADLVDLVAAGSFAFVFHLAGHADVPASVRHPRSDLEMNLLTTVRVLEALRAAARPARLVFASSAAVYGEAREDRPLREDDPTLPVAPYGVSKLAAERYVAVEAGLHGLPAASLRLFPVYGPRSRKHVVHDLALKLLADPDRLVLQGDGRQVRDFLHVSDVVEAFLLVAERAPLRGEVYNVASGRPCTIRELADALAAAAGASPRVETTEPPRGVSVRWTADVGRLAELGFRPRRELEAGLEDTVAWLRGTGCSEDEGPRS